MQACLPKGELVHNCASLTVEPVEEGAACACGAGQLCCCLCAAVLCLPRALGMAGCTPCATASLQEPRGWSEATSVLAASACSCPDPALSSHIFCPQHQMAGQCLLKMVSTGLEDGLIHSAASQWLGILPANHGHFCLSRSLCLWCGRAVPVIPGVLGKGWLQDTFVSLQRQSWNHSYF